MLASTGYAAPAPVGAWLFDEGMNSNNISGIGHHGELKGGAGLSADDGAPMPPTPKGTAEFGGQVGSVIDCGPALRKADALALMAWASPNDTAALPALIEALSDEYAGTRGIAAIALKKIGTPGALKAVEVFVEAQ